MKIIEVTIKSEKTYLVEIDETVINQEIIDDFSKYMYDIKDIPSGLSWNRNGIEEKDYPYFHFAQDVAYMQSEYESDVEGLPVLHNKAYTHRLVEGVIPPIQFKELSEDFEYEFNLKNCKL